jgi:hypothetical protein
MAYMDQERKKVIAAGLKPIRAKYGVKASLSVRNHSTIVLKIREGDFDPAGDMCHEPWQGSEFEAQRVVDVNPYHYERHFDGRTLEFLKEAFAVLNNGNHDRSDIMTDYFDVGWYVDVRFGDWKTPYRYNSVT